MKNVLVDNEFAEVSYETDLKLGKIVWKKSPHSKHRNEGW